MSAKRSDYISWDEYFMGVAHLSGMRSKDPNTQVGACIVSPDNKILSMGYNGLTGRIRLSVMPIRIKVPDRIINGRSTGTIFSYQRFNPRAA